MSRTRRNGASRFDVSIEQAPPKDRPFGWIVTVKTPTRLSCAPVMAFGDAIDRAARELWRLAREPELYP